MTNGPPEVPGGMRTGFMFVFLAIFLLYALINYYIFIRGFKLIPRGSSLRIWYAVAFIVLAAAFIAGRLLERVWLSPVSGFLVWSGSFWLAALLYLLLAVLAIDILRGVDHFLPLFPAAVRVSPLRAARIAAAIVAGAVLLILAGGFINALHPRVLVYDVGVPKPADGRRSLTAAVATDIHLGTIIGRGRLTGIVNRINALQPDVIFLVGDILDEDLAPVIRQNTGHALLQLRAPLGVIGVTGNHEFIGGVKPAIAYLSTHGVQLLLDQRAELPGGIQIVGRMDRVMPYFTGQERMPLDELLLDVDRQRPLILLDHQPMDFDLVAERGVDLMISGHTHKGQVWPVNLVSRLIYGHIHGWKTIGSTRFYVSCGVGTWGPPIRVGNRPEIVLMRITFEAGGQGPVGAQ